MLSDEIIRALRTYYGEGFVGGEHKAPQEVIDRLERIQKIIGKCRYGEGDLRSTQVLAMVIEEYERMATHAK